MLSILSRRLIQVCLYLDFTSCIPEISRSFLVTSYDRGHITIVGVYAPKEGREKETRRFHKQLQIEVDKYSKSDSLILSGHLNARVGNQPIPNVVGKYD